MKGLSIKKDKFHGRITEVQEVLWNSAREAARDASLGEDNLQTVASNLLTYLQGAEPDGLRPGAFDLA